MPVELTEDRIREIVREEMVKDKKAYADSMRPFYQKMGEVMRAASERAEERRAIRLAQRSQHEATSGL